MRLVYSFLTQWVWYGLHVISWFSGKLNLFIDGRKKTFSIIQKKLPFKDDVIWLHAASLGEYEQGLPVLKELKQNYPKHKIILTFFSPSGFEVKKNNTPADVALYLPMDTQSNVKIFLDWVNPKMAVFIKYEIWPNYLYELKKRNIPTILVSGIFSKRQIFFRWYGSFMRKSLKTFTHFFVQEAYSKQLLNNIGFQNVTISGDTRFDRVSDIVKQDNSLDFMDAFKGDKMCLVAGSTWAEDEEILLDFINDTDENMKFVIAPHNINRNHIKNLQNVITKRTLLYSEIHHDNLINSDVLIIDTIGLLTKVYSYADFAYVGGGFATGLHNTLEPAVFGIPVLIGPQYQKFNEAVEMVQRKGILVIKDKEDFRLTISQLFTQPNFKKRIGAINARYVQEQTGATATVLDFVSNLLYT